MEQMSAFIGQLAQEAISLAILVTVLVGLYRLTQRVLDILQQHFQRCCEQLERIADAIEDFTEA